MNKKTVTAITGGNRPPGGSAALIARPSSWFILASCVVFAGCATYHSKPISAAKTAAAFNARSLEAPGLRAFLRTNGVAVPSSDDPWGLKQLTLAAFYYQPTLAEARAQLLAADAARITAGERPNPSVSFTPTYDTSTGPPWIPGLSFDIPIETAGKRGKRIAVAERLAAAARWKLIGTVWRVRGGVRASLLGLYAARQTVSLLARQEAAQSNVVQLLEGQFNAGNISSYEVTQARIALDTTRMAWQQASGQYHQARVQLANALGLPLQALGGTSFSFAELNRFPSDLTRPAVRRQAILNRADVRGALASYAASQAALQLQIARQYPDVHLGPGYELDQTDNKWTLGLSMTLPILNQNQGPIAEAKAKRSLAAAHFQTVQSRAIGQIESALEGYRAALRQMATAEAMLKNLRQRLASVRAQVQAGEAEPLVLANAEVAFETGAQNRLAAQIQGEQALGRLEDAVQSPLTLSSSTLEAAEAAAVSK